MNALVTIETLTPSVVFAPGGVEGIISKLETEVRAIERDITTPDGREAVKSLAYKVARSKTALDEMGKELVADIKKKSGAIDAERRVIRERLDALRDEVRGPLTAWEDSEGERIAGHERELVWLAQSHQFATTPTVAMIRGHISDVGALRTRDWQEFKERADAAIADALPKLEAMLVAVEQAERDADELAELRRLKAEREAADQVAAEAKAKSDREAQEAEAQAERERLRAEQTKRDQEAAIARALDLAKANAARELAKAEQATRDAEAATAKAVEDEKKRVAAVAAAEKAAAAKREANQKHRAKFNNEVLAALVGCGLTEELGKIVIASIARGEVPHVSIAY